MDARLSSPNWISMRHAYQEALQQGQLDRYLRRRWDKAETYQGWLEQDTLTSLSAQQGQVLYRAAGGRRTAEFRQNSEEDLRDSLDFLLYDTITLEARFAECVSEQGAFKLDGAGREFVSYVLCLTNPGLFAVWNPSSERALRRFGWYTSTMSKGHLGLAYLEVLEALDRIRRGADFEQFQQVDGFCYFVSRTPVSSIS